MVGAERGDGFREACRGRVYLRGEQMRLKPARRRWWRIRTGSGGRQASLCKYIVLVVEKQFVLHR